MLAVSSILAIKMCAISCCNFGRIENLQIKKSTVNLLEGLLALHVTFFVVRIVARIIFGS